jgi:uncharacterized protein (DUF3084 family)
LIFKPSALKEAWQAVSVRVLPGFIPLTINSKPYLYQTNSLNRFLRMDTLSEVVKSIKAKTEKMLALQQALRQENVQFQEQTKRLKSRVEELENANRKLEYQNKALLLAQSVAGSESSPGSENKDRNLAIKLKINELVREIDKCIAQLNR